MIRRFAALLAVCLFLVVPVGAHGTEAEEDVFVSPTRNPNAAPYDSAKPEELQADQIVAHSFILMERTSGNVLMEQNADELMFPASTTKILTALMALKYAEASDLVTISEAALDLPKDASRVPFKLGEVVTLEDALYGLMLKSGNEAANAIAEYIAGNVNTFVAMMNEEARGLGCTNTNFTNPHGYHDDAHYTTARDLAIMMNVALDHPTFRKIVATPTYNLSATNENPSRKITNSNLHILPTTSSGENNQRYYAPSIGGKTGFTSQAGYVLVEAAEKNGVELIAVVMMSGKYSHWPDTSWLFEYGFTQFKSVTPEEMYEENPITLQINGFDLNDTFYDGKPGLGRLDLSIRSVDSTREVRITKLAPEVDAIVENFSSYINVSYTVELRAPITQGQVVGILTFYPDGEDPVDYELIATRSVAARADAPPTLEEIEQRVQEDPSPFPPFGWDWVLPPVLALFAVILILRALFRTARRRRKSKKQIPKPKRRYYS